MGKQLKFHDVADFSLGQSPVQDKTEPNVERIWQNLQLPEKSWSKLRFAAELHVAFFGICEREGDWICNIRLPKAVTFQEGNNQREPVQCFVYVRGVKQLERIVKSFGEAQAVLDATH